MAHWEVRGTIRLVDGANKLSVNGVLFSVSTIGGLQPFDLQNVTTSEAIDISYANDIDADSGSAIFRYDAFSASPFAECLLI